MWNIKKSKKNYQGRKGHLLKEIGEKIKKENKNSASAEIVPVKDPDTARHFFVCPLVIV